MTYMRLLMLFIRRAVIIEFSFLDICFQPQPASPPGRISLQNCLAKFITKSARRFRFIYYIPAVP